MFMLAAETRNVWLQVVGCALVGLLGASYLFLARRHPFTLGLVWPRNAVVGDMIDISCRLRNVSGRSTRPMRVLIASCANTPLIAPVVVYFDPLIAGGDRQASAKRELGVRGATDHLHATVDVVAPFGFFVLRSAHTFRDELRVAPSPVRSLDLPRILGAQPDANGVVGPGLEVRGVREWRPGDAARHVHWRSTARTGRLTVLEYGEPTIGSVGVLAAGTAGDPQFEAAVAVVAATARDVVDGGGSVFVALDDPASSRVEQLTSHSWHDCFAEIGAAVVGPPATVDRLFDNVGSDGIVLVAVGEGVPLGWRAYVEAVAVSAGVRLVEVSDHAAELVP
jgi:uncharacterized protein (DUF58 family)